MLMRIRIGIAALLLPATLVTPFPALADWEVSRASRVSYVSIKNNAIAEHNTFSGVTGSVNKKGELRVSIDLSTVQTQVEIRNERMRDLFFEVAQYPTATVSTQLFAEELAQLDSGAPLQMVKPFKLTLHGVEAEVEAHIRVLAVGDRAWVTTLQPILISAADFGLGEGVNTLRKLAGLDAIASVIPVSVDLRFRKN